MVDRPFCVWGKEQQQAFDAKVEQKINALMPYLKKLSGGNEDLIQEGAIGTWQSMMNDTEAPWIRSVLSPNPVAAGDACQDAAGKKYKRVFHLHDA